MKNLFKNDALKTFIVVGIAMLFGLLMAFFDIVDLNEVLRHYQWGIIIIYISMELFTCLIIGTGIMEKLVVVLAKVSKGNSLPVICLFSLLLFLVSAFLNNLTAVMVVLPIIFGLLRGIRLDGFYVISFFSLLLAISNLGGAATPIGDFPAIVIMKSGITTFIDYLWRAFPLFAFTAVVVTLIHLFLLKNYRLHHKSESEMMEQELGILFLNTQYKYFKIRQPEIQLIALAFFAMFCGWIFLPPEHYPPEIVAVTGLSLAVLLAVPCGGDVDFRSFDMKPVLTIGSFLFIASVAGNSGILEMLASWLQHEFKDPVQLLIAMMILTALSSGIFSAGPAAAAMMPVVKYLADGPLHDQSHWLAISFAASICAGSSLFLWSATAGFLLYEKVDTADLQNKQGKKLTWGLVSYFKYGILHFIVQISIAIIWILCVFYLF